jgi:hypothetical protein
MLAYVTLAGLADLKCIDSRNEATIVGPLLEPFIVFTGVEKSMKFSFSGAVSLDDASV